MTKMEKEELMTHQKNKNLQLDSAQQIGGFGKDIITSDITCVEKQHPFIVNHTQNSNVAGFKP